MNDRFALVLNRVDLCLFELQRIVSRGPRIKIVHRFRKAETGCFPGEEVAWVLLIHRCREYCLRLPLSLTLLFDYLARNRRFPQSAAQISSGLRSDPFYVRHAANAETGKKRTRRFSPGSIKEYVKRLRCALRIAFREVGLRLDPFAVLVSVPTEGNQVCYQLKVIVDWVHIDRAK
jgi:hypothetical protein